MKSGSMGRRMLAAWIGAMAAGPFVAACAVQAYAQTSSTRVAAGSTGPQPANPTVREIKDPQNGYRWILIPSASVPSGPGRLVLVDDAESEGEQISERSQGAKLVVSNARPTLVVHAGDAVIVEEHTAVVDSTLEAVALGSATKGAEFNVRLRVGGAVMHARALDAGRATLLTKTGATR